MFLDRRAGVEPARGLQREMLILAEEAEPAAVAGRGAPGALWAGRATLAGKVDVDHLLLSVRIAARTAVETVRWRSRALSKPIARRRSRMASSIVCSALPVQCGATAELAEHRGIEARIGQLRGEGVLPVDAAPHGRGRLLIREALGVLQHHDERHTPGRFHRLVTHGERGGKLRVQAEDAQFIAHTHVRIAFRKSGTSDTGIGGGVARPRGAIPAASTTASKIASPRAAALVSGHPAP